MRGARRVCKRGPQVGPKGPFGPAGVFCLFAIAGFEKCLYLCNTKAELASVNVLTSCLTKN